MNKTILTNVGIAITCLALGFFVPQYISNHENTPAIEIELKGETSLEVAKLGRFSVVIANAPKNLQKTIAWKVMEGNKPVDFEALPDDRIIFPVGVKPTKLTVLSHVVYIDPKTKKLSNSDFFIKEVNVGNVPNPPSPTPTPNPTPSPDGPKDGKYKIAVMAYTTAVALVRSGDIAKGAAALSNGFKLTADEIGKNKYATLKDVYAGLKANNTDALNKAGENASSWEDWEKALQHYVASLQNDKKLPSITDHADLFREIADGLSYIK